MVNFYAQEAVPERFRSRLLYQHSPSVALMRTPLEENIRIGEDIGGKLAIKKSPTVIPFHGKAMFWARTGEKMVR